MAMKFYKTLNQYKCSNLIYDANTETAYSYEWYEIAKRIKGIMILNDYAYSPTTANHARKIASLFDDLGIKYVRIEAPRGLQCLNIAKEHYNDLINILQAKIDNPRSGKHLLLERHNELTCLKESLALIEGLLA